MLNKVGHSMGQFRFFSGKTSITIFSIAVYLLLSPISRAQWTQTNGPPDFFVSTIAINGSDIFAGTWGRPNCGIYQSTNNGFSWSLSLNLPVGMFGGSVTSIVISESNIYAASYYNDEGGPYASVYRSTNDGLTWVEISGMVVNSLAVFGSHIFAGTFGGVYHSTDHGNNWTQTSLNNVFVFSLAINNSYIFAGTDDSGVYLSTDSGQSWNQTPLNNQTVLSLAVSGTFVFAGTVDSGVYLSINNGQNWLQTLNNQTVYSVAVSGSNVFAGTYDYPNGHGVYRSSDNGQTWTPWNNGEMENKSVYALAFSSEYIFAGTECPIWRRPLSDLVGIEAYSEITPNNYNLYQNYPNPFNPVTTIKFGIPKESRVKLVIYDIFGREITTLVNEQLKSGSYEVDWNASNYSSGVYFYQLSSENYSETKRMVLIK